MDEKEIKKTIEKSLFNKEKIFNNIMEKIEEEEFKDNLNILLLLIINRKESYGGEISKEISILTKNKLKDRESLIYPMLHKLESENLIRSYWRENRKYYFIEVKGKKYLKEKKSVIDIFKGSGKIALKEEFSWI